MIPVYSRLDIEEIRSLRGNSSLAIVNRSVDTVLPFRRPEDLMRIAKLAIVIGVKALWGQFGVVDHDTAVRAEKAGMKVVPGRCPKS
ncbi:MAG: CoA-binding protein [Paracoccaceae bacterium]|nr:CoA-binding protein [Paracoccaceae bacterium]